MALNAVRHCQAKHSFCITGRLVLSGWHWRYQVATLLCLLPLKTAWLSQNCPCKEKSASEFCGADTKVAQLLRGCSSLWCSVSWRLCIITLKVALAGSNAFGLNKNKMFFCSALASVAWSGRVCIATWIEKNVLEPVVLKGGWKDVERLLLRDYCRLQDARTSFKCAPDSIFDILVPKASCCVKIFYCESNDNPERSLMERKLSRIFPDVLFR